MQSLRSSGINAQSSHWTQNQPHCTHTTRSLVFLITLDASDYEASVGTALLCNASKKRYHAPNASTCALWHHVLRPIAAPWPSLDGYLLLLCSTHNLDTTCLGLQKLKDHFTGHVPSQFTGADCVCTGQLYSALQRLRLFEIPLRTDAAAPAILHCGSRFVEREAVFFPHHCQSWPGVPSDTALQG